MPDDKGIIDINDPILQQEMVEADPDADWFEQAAPPPDDRDYQVKILLGEHGMIAKKQQRKGDTNGTRTGPMFLSLELELRIVDPGQPWDNMPTSYWADSLIWDNKGTSKLHTILRAVGAPARGNMTIADLRDHTLGVLASEPLAFCEGKWEARAKDAENEYRTVLKGMKNFPLIDPQHPEHGHSPFVEDVVTKRRDPKTQQIVEVGTGEVVRAYFRVNRIFAR